MLCGLLVYTICHVNDSDFTLEKLNKKVLVGSRNDILCALFILAIYKSIQ